MMLWGCASAPQPGGELRSAAELLASSRSAACELADHFAVVDMVPAGSTATALRITHPDPVAATRRLNALWPEGPPAGVGGVTVERPRAKLAVVLDDFGLHDDQLRRVWGLGEPFTYAILPQQTYSAGYAGWLRQRGASILAHIPMEPHETAHMTLPGFLRADMSDAQRIRLLREHLASLPGAIGWNNHMGSRLTSDAAAMNALVSATATDLVVLDSRTSVETALERVARAVKRPAARRHLFIDNDRDVDHIRIQLNKALHVARRTGKAVAIGHAYPETALALKQFVARHGDEVQLVPIERVASPQVEPAWVRACKRQVAGAR